MADERIIRWFDRLDKPIQAIAARLVVLVVRSAVWHDGAYYYECGPAYLAAIYGVSIDQATAHHMGVFAGLMAAVRAGPLNPRTSRDRQLVEALSSAGLVRRGRQGTWWRVSEKGHAALTALGVHARSRGYAVPSIRVGPAVPLAVRARPGGQLRAACPLHADYYTRSLRLCRGGSAYCYHCFRSVGRWRKTPEGFRLWPFLREVEAADLPDWSVEGVRAAGLPDPGWFNPEGGETGLVHPGGRESRPRAAGHVLHRSAADRTRADYPQHTDLIRQVRAMEHTSSSTRSINRARRAWEDETAEVAVQEPRPHRRWALSDPYLTVAIRSHATCRIGKLRGAYKVIHPRHFSRVIGTQWIGLACTGPAGVEDSALEVGAMAVQTAIGNGRWSEVLSGRLAVVRGAPGSVSLAVEMNTFRRDSVGFLSDPCVRAMLRDLCALVGDCLSAAGWAHEALDVSPVIAVPGWRVVQDSEGPTTYRGRLIYASETNTCGRAVS